MLSNPAVCASKQISTGRRVRLQTATMGAGRRVGPADVYISSACRAFETPAQAELRLAAERARLIAQMEAEDAAEDGGA